mmetsp:Transcript_33529/g.32598  ORF Transcript_33529/g.32598 Transcript_33529/m.32598 type:complete len:126 (-) Transcript_33529:661-1038(-)
MNNLGRAVDELYNEPFQGMLQKNAKQTVIGLGKGFKGLFVNSTIGISKSVGGFAGSLYERTKRIEGATDVEANMDNPKNILHGIRDGSVGLLKEVGLGIAGVVMIPNQRVREQGCGCGQVTKGTA